LPTPRATGADKLMGIHYCQKSPRGGGSGGMQRCGERPPYSFLPPAPAPSAPPSPLRPPPAPRALTHVCCRKFPSQMLDVILNGVSVSSSSPWPRRQHAPRGARARTPVAAGTGCCCSGAAPRMAGVRFDQAYIETNACVLPPHARTTAAAAAVVDRHAAPWRGQLGDAGGSEGARGRTRVSMVVVLAAVGTPGDVHTSVVCIPPMCVLRRPPPFFRLLISTT